MTNFFTYSFCKFPASAFTSHRGVLFLFFIFLVSGAVDAQEAVPQDNQPKEETSGVIHIMGGAAIIGLEEKTAPLEKSAESLSDARPKASSSEQKPETAEPKPMIAEAKKKAKKIDIKTLPQKQSVELPAQENPNSFTSDKSKASVVLQDKHQQAVAANGNMNIAATGLLYLHTTIYKRGEILFSFYSRFRCRPPPVAIV